MTPEEEQQLAKMPTLPADRRVKAENIDSVMANVGMILLDVREPKEIEELGGYKGAINIPVTQLEKRLGELPKPLVVQDERQQHVHLIFDDLSAFKPNLLFLDPGAPDVPDGLLRPRKTAGDGVLEALGGRGADFRNFRNRHVYLRSADVSSQALSRTPLAPLCFAQCAQQ
jgi:hypothetical protein